MPSWADWDLWGLHADAQGTESNAKDDTLYYGRDDGAGIADLATDLSQHGDDQATGATWHYEASPASRFDVLSPMTIELRALMTNGHNGQTLAFYGSGTSRVHMTLTSTSVQARINNVSLAALALPGLGAGAQEYVIGWEQEPNPYTTGAGDAVRSVAYAWNIDTGVYAQTVFTHAERATGTGPQVWWASTITGTATFTGTPLECRWSAGRVRTTTETHEDFVDQTTEPTLELAARCEFPIVDPACDLRLGGQLAGPVHFMGAQAVKQNQFRAFSPIVNEAYVNRPEIALSSFAAIPTQYRREAPDSEYTLLLPWAFYRRVPPTATHLRVRVFVKHWNAATLLVRMYAMNRPPAAANVPDQGEALEAPFCGATVTNDHGSGGTDGEWVDLGLVRPAVNSRGCTWLALALDTQGNPGTSLCEIGAIVVEPGVVE